MKRVALLVVALVLELLPSVRPAEALRVYASGDFVHSSSSVPYINHWSGALDAEATSGQGGTTVALSLRRGGTACRLFGSWRTATGTASSTLPIEMCVANDQASAAQLAAWLDGQGSADPTLVIPLVSGQGGEFINVAPVSAQVFVRGCSSSTATLQRYGSLIAGGGTLRFVPSTDQQGNPMLTLSASALTVASVDSAAWQTVLKSCRGKAAGLSTVPGDGQSINFAGSSEPPLEGPNAAPLVHLQQAEDAVMALASAAVLTPSKHKSLVTRLHKARGELRRAGIAKAVKQLQKFKGKTSNLIKAGALTASQGQLLLQPAERAQEHVLWLQVQARTRYAIGSCAPPPCDYPDEYVIYRVSNASKRKAGSPPVDFNNIGAALDAAEALGVCGVELIIEPGTYDGNQVVTRDTRFTGEDRERVVVTGSIVNLDDVALRLNRLTLRSVGTFGAVHVDSPCALTTLTGIDISRSRFYGVRQNGGGLQVVDATISETQTDAGSLRAGTGIYLTGGAQAVVENSTLEQNGAAALVAAGIGTKVHVSLSVIDGDLTTPHFDPTDPLGDGFAAVEVLDEALLLMEFTAVNRNELLGLYVHGDSQGHARDSSFAQTEGRLGAGGGHNFFARQTSFELTRITTAGAAGTGLFVGAASVGGIVEGTFVTGTDCEVINNRTGVFVDSTPPDADPKYHPELCIAVETFDGNIRDSEVDPLVVPCGVGEVNAHCPPSPCHHVPFDCGWCGEG